MKRTALNRRDFLHMGGAAMLLPFIAPGIAPGLARAASAPGRAKQLIIFHTPDGTYPAKWKPANASAPNAAFTGPLMFNEMHQNADFMALKDNLIFVDGLSMNNVSAGHDGCKYALTCGGNISFDNFVAKALSAGSRVPSLSMRVLFAPKVNPFNDVSYANGAVSSNLTSPAEAFKQLFSGMGTGTAATALKAQRKSVLDAVQGQIAAVQKQLGKSETTKLEAHLDAVRRVEQALDGAGSGAPQCGAPAAVADVTDARSYFTATGDAMVQLAALGVGCGITPVATLAWAGEAEDAILWAADPSITANDGYHGTLSHRSNGDDSIKKLIKCEQWFAGEFAKLVNGLKQVPDLATPGKSAFDTSIVIWTRSMGDGSDHTNYSIPFIIAAGSETGLKTAAGGRYMNYGGYDQFEEKVTPPGLAGETWYTPRAGEPHQRVFATLAQALGVPMTGFGLSAYPTKGDPMAPLAEFI